jgi:Putative glutamine amidotransferase
MKAAGITLSTVGAGGGANPFLEQLAKQGGGRFYAAANVASIPDIFLKETEQVAGQQIIEEPFFPILAGASPIVRGLDDKGFPQLLGYNGTTLKSAAQLVLVSPRDDPLLAQWQYGLGRSVAWTSDSTGKWAKNWVGWSGFNKFFSQLVSWTFPGEETGGIEASFETLGGETRLHVQSVETDGSPRDFYKTMATIVGPDLVPHEVVLDQVAPGVYEQGLGEIDSGAYAVRITQTRPGAAALGRTVGLVEPVSAEYRLLGVNLPFLASLRGATGGREIQLPADPWAHDLQTTASFTELWPLLLVLALLLWPLDIALRRVSLGRRELVDARAWVGRRWRSRGRAAPRTAASEGMLAARDRAAGGAARAALLRGPEPPTGAANPDGTTANGARPAADAARPAATPTQPPAIAPEPKVMPAAPGASIPAEPKPEEMDTLARLREAKRRRERQ